MRLLLLICSIAFAVLGLSPYKKASNLDITKPNELIVDSQECGCPCPDANIIKGQLQIPQNIISMHGPLPMTQINLDIKGLYEPYNYELAHARLFIKGKVVGVDTILCNPSNCELAPRFLVESWALIDPIARAWVFPKWAGLLFLINLLIFMPTLIINEIIIRIRPLQRKNDKPPSNPA